MDSYKIYPQDIISIYDEELGHLEDLTGEQMAQESPEWSGEIGLGDTVNTDQGEKRIVELTNSIPSNGEKVTRYKIVLGIYPKK